MKIAESPKHKERTPKNIHINNIMFTNKRIERQNEQFLQNNTQTLNKSPSTHDSPKGDSMFKIVSNLKIKDRSKNKQLD